MKWNSLSLAALALAIGGLPALADDNVVKIGVIAAESGDFTSAGTAISAAVKLAVKEINDAGGFKVGDKTYKLEAYYRDDRTNIDTAIAAARELVDDVGVKAIWGTESHDFSVAMTKITGPAKVLQFTGNSSLGGLLMKPNAVEAGQPLHYAFQTEPREFERSGSTANGVFKLLPAALGSDPKNSSVLVADDLGGQYLTEHYLKALGSHDQTVSRTFYPPNTKDFTALLTRIKGEKPDILHIWYNPDETLVALPQAIQLAAAKSYFVIGVDPGVWQDRKLTAGAPVVVSCIALCWGQPPSQKVSDYFNRYFALGAQKSPQASVSLLYYDYVHWYVQALQAVGRVDDPDAVVDYLMKSKYDGVLAQVPLQFNENHQVMNVATEVCLVQPNTSDKFTCALEQPPATPPPGDNGG
jgi:branched-chain amino acid transport system substrate-binding protein